MVLIGLELVESIKMYIEEDVIHAEVVVMVAIIAVARKIIVVDYEKIPYEVGLSIAALMIALSVGYFLLKRADLPLRSKKFGEDT